MTTPNLEANFSTLILSLASASLMAMGHAPNPNTGKVEKDLTMARFNIDLLLLLKDKTKNNLTAEENRFLTSALNDLQLKFVQAQGSQNPKA